MAEVFGIAAGAVGIAATFSTCIDCFDYVQAGRHLGRDFQTEMLMFDCARYRLASWGKAANIYSNPQPKSLDISDDSLELVKRVLFQILQLFENSKTIAERYEPVTWKDNSSTSVDLDPTITKLDKKLRQLALRPRNEKGLLKKTTWAVYHRKEFKELIDGITRLVEELERLTQACDKRLQVVKQDVEEIHNEEGLDLVAGAAENIDPLLHSAVKESVNKGHCYANIHYTEDVKVLNGDSFGSGWTGPITQRVNTYRDILIEGNARVINGNKYGGKDLFED